MEGRVKNSQVVKKFLTDFNRKLTCNITETENKHFSLIMNFLPHPQPTSVHIIYSQIITNNFLIIFVKKKSLSTKNIYIKIL